MKRLNKKGFTLIELLAVIVILAVLILLALPNVLKIMENARKKAFEQEVRGMLKAAQMKYVEMSLNNQNLELNFNYRGLGNCVIGSCVLDNIELKKGWQYNIRVRTDSSGNLIYYYSIQSAKDSNNKRYNAQSGLGDPITYRENSRNYVPFDHIIGYPTSSL